MTVTLLYNKCQAILINSFKKCLHFFWKIMISRYNLFLFNKDITDNKINLLISQLLLLFFFYLHFVLPFRLTLSLNKILWKSTHFFLSLDKITDEKTTLYFDICIFLIILIELVSIINYHTMQRFCLKIIISKVMHIVIIVLIKFLRVLLVHYIFIKALKECMF